MLEWYRASAGYLDVLADTRTLLRDVARETLGRPESRFRGETIGLEEPWHILPVRDAFRNAAGWDPFETFDADRFDIDLVEKVEPALPRDRPTVLLDYPPPLAALSRCRAGIPPVAERWELYVGGIELANAFGELTDPAEQRRRFEECAEARRQIGKPVYPMDEAFLAALDRGLPDCAGVALGIDRLVMLLADADSVADVQAFPRR
jgi:lysyl-tRNA synthetase class 2